ncbi:proline dehydrogenase family protein [Rhodococcus sp. 24CO]|uniref:proline dehydrogenase family protein n=1 Tax=Rhodococcus sp. 24CO TaxID=3117460 RepID=UPI003D35567F
MKPSAVLTNSLRPVILAAARSPRCEHAITRAPLSSAVVNRFVAGRERSDAIAVVSRLLDDGRYVSVDFLGENVTDAVSARATVHEYLSLIEELGKFADTLAPVPRVEVSVKLSALGAERNTDVAAENARIICAAAQSAGLWVTVDAEDHTTTDATLATVRSLRVDFPWLGTVLQAYLRRTESDCLAFADARIRLCKGAYNEPEAVAYIRREDVTASYLRCLDILCRGTGYPMVASHDPVVIAAAARMFCGVERFEYQMLFGIREPEQARLVAGGQHVRTYVPYGSAWYPYFMRRLAERPANLAFFLRSVVSRH